jgi:hypothetical protein
LSDASLWRVIGCVDLAACMPFGDSQFQSCCFIKMFRTYLKIDLALETLHSRHSGLTSLRLLRTAGMTTSNSFYQF